MLLLALLVALGSARPAAAHAELVSSTPSDGAALAEAPTTLELRFNEPVGIVDGTIRLLALDADPTPLTAAASDATITVELPELPTDATYAVAYRVVSADGHPVSGVVTFSIGDADPAAPPVAATETPATAELLVRVLSGALYLGLLAFAGLVFSTRTILRGPGGNLRSLRLAERWMLGVACLAALLLVPASGLRVVGAGPVAAVHPSTWWPGVSPVVAVVPLVVAVFGWAAHLLGRRSGPGAGTPTNVLSALLAGVAVLAPAAVGHTVAFNPPVMLLADAGHLLGGAFWLGGLLALAAWVRFRLLPASRSRPKFFRALRHEAALLVGVVLITGVLANTSPSHHHQHGPQQVAVESQGLTVEGALTPGAVGANSFVFTLGFDGVPAAPEELEVSFRMPAQDLGPVAATVEPRGEGSFVATVNLPVAGVWEAQVAARISKFERPIAVFDVTLA